MSSGAIKSTIKTANLRNVLTESALRRMAGARSFEHGVWYFNGKHVRSVAKEEKFSRELAALRVTHKAKRNFMKLLDHAKWE